MNDDFRRMFQENVEKLGVVCALIGLGGDESIAAMKARVRECRAATNAEVTLVDLTVAQRLLDELEIAAMALDPPPPAQRREMVARALARHRAAHSVALRYSARNTPPQKERAT